MWGVILQYDAERSRHIKDCVLQSAAFHRCKETQSLFMILDKSSARATDIAHILKKHKSVIRQTVAFHTIVKLDFLAAKDNVSYCAT